MSDCDCQTCRSLMRLETADGKLVGYARPVLPPPLQGDWPKDVLIWGQRLFVRSEAANTWRETLPCVVESSNGP